MNATYDYSIKIYNTFHPMRILNKLFENRYLLVRLFFSDKFRLSTIILNSQVRLVFNIIIKNKIKQKVVPVYLFVCDYH